MVHRWRYVCLIVVLAGCFQQAGESLQPVDSTSTPAATTSSNNNAEQTENNSELNTSTDSNSLENDSATPTFPPITVISPRDITPFATVTPLVPDTATPDTDSSGDVAITQQVITPISPLMGNVDTAITPDANTQAIPESSATNTTSEGTEEAVVEPDTETITASSSSDTCTYRVQPGDNLYRIAIGNDFSLQEMRDANPDLVGEAPVLQPGQVLNLPSCDGSAAPEPASVVQPASPDQTPVAGQPGQSYTVQRGDTLLAIANRFGITVRQIVAANNIADPNRLSVGQVIIIPVSAE